MSNDSLAILMLCSRLALPEEESSDALRQREWIALQERLRIAGFDGPGALLGMSQADMQSALNTTTDAARIARLLSRADAILEELDRLQILDIWTVTSVDDGYPARYHERFSDSAPPVLFGMGDRSILSSRGIAVVGSREASETAIECATFVGQACARDEWAVFSGGAKGIDAAALNGALESNGTAAAVLADNLQRTSRSAAIRSWIEDGLLALVTPLHPNAGFSVGAAMGRNKLIYTLADFALVVSSDAEKGGTWAGATETLRAKWVPLFVLDSPDVPDGNRRLLKRGATAFPHPYPTDVPLWSWFEQRAAETVAENQGRLF